MISCPHDCCQLFARDYRLFKQKETGNENGCTTARHEYCIVTSTYIYKNRLWLLMPWSSAPCPEGDVCINNCAWIASCIRSPLENIASHRSVRTGQHPKIVRSYYKSFIVSDEMQIICPKISVSLSNLKRIPYRRRFFRIVNTYAMAIFCVW